MVWSSVYSFRFLKQFKSYVDDSLTLPPNLSVMCGFCLGFPGLCIGISVDSLPDCGKYPSGHDLVNISSNLYNGGFPKLIIILLVMQSGPGDFVSLSLVKTLVNYSYEIGEFITGGISSGSLSILHCYRVSPCIKVSSCRSVIL